MEGISSPKDKSDLSNEACRTRLSDKPEGEIPETMFHHLRRNGYYTVGIGKISHYVDGCLYGYEAPKTEKPELPYSWDEMLFDAGKWGNGWNAFFGYASLERSDLSLGKCPVNMLARDAPLVGTCT